MRRVCDVLILFLWIPPLLPPPLTQEPRRSQTPDSAEPADCQYRVNAFVL